MGREQLRSRMFWKLIATVIVGAALAYVCFGLTGGLPTWAREVTGGLGFGAAGASALAGVIAIAFLRAPPDDPRGRQTPTGGQPVWFTRLDGGEQLLPDGPVIAIGAATTADVRLDGLAVQHARVRVWPWLVDVGRLGRGPVRIDGQDVARGGWADLADGQVLEVGGHRLRVNIGWRADAADARVGTRAGAHLLAKRAGATPRGTRYVGRDAIVERLERRPMTDDELIAYVATSAAGHRSTPSIAIAETLRDADGTAVIVWPGRPATEDLVVRPETVYALCKALAPLHAAGQAHGALTPSHRLPFANQPAMFAAALPAPDGVPPAQAGDAPYRVAGRTDDDRDGDGADDDEAFHAPERRAGGPASPRADVFALARMLERSLAGPAGDQPWWAAADRAIPSSHHADAPAWITLLRTALADDPAARPAHAAALAHEIMLAAARSAPAGSFAGQTFGDCASCGEHLVAIERGATTMFDGRRADGRMMGGQSTTIIARCLGCGDDTSGTDRQAY